MLTHPVGTMAALAVIWRLVSAVQFYFLLIFFGKRSMFCFCSCGSSAQANTQSLVINCWSLLTSVWSWRTVKDLNKDWLNVNLKATKNLFLRCKVNIPPPPKKEIEHSLSSSSPPVECIRRWTAAQFALNPPPRAISYVQINTCDVTLERAPCSPPSYLPPAARTGDHSRGLILRRRSCYKLQPKTCDLGLLQMIYSAGSRPPFVFSTPHTGEQRERCSGAWRIEE